MSKDTQTTTTFICDRCGKKRADTHFPANGVVLVTHDLHDFQGAAVAGAKVEKELCDECLDVVLRVVQGEAVNVMAIE